MDIFISPEIAGYAETIIRKTLGTKTELQSIKSAAGGLYNKVFYVYTSRGSYILKIECNEIFPSTRIGTIENEVEGTRVFTQAGILCPKVLAYDFTNNEVGVRYVFSERVSGNNVANMWDAMTSAIKGEVDRQACEAIARMLSVKNSHFGNLTPSGPLGWHKTWGECYRAWFHLLINDGIRIGLFTDEELSILSAAAETTTVNKCKYSPTLDHGDIGKHNMIWGHINDEPDALYFFDFGYTGYVLPHLTVWGYAPRELPSRHFLDKGLNLLLLYDFEIGVMWKEMQKMTDDYAHCERWIADRVEKSKKDTSRDHVTNFVERCRLALQ